MSFRWFVPLVAGAAAVILWVAAPGDERAEPGQQANAALSREVSPPPPDVKDEKADKAENAGRVDRFNDQARSEPPAPSNEAAANAENKTASAAADERERDQLKDAAPSEGRAATALDKVSPQEPAAPPPAAAADAGARAASPLAETIQRQRQAFTPVPIEIRSPDPSIRWRIGPGGSVERTTDGGTTWASAPTGTAADLTAGSSPAPSVCWLVGRAGTVLVSTDGSTWRRVAFPEVTDLAGVLAADARTVTISTADGRRFRTADGGMTWTQ
jgi:hypothetical protein